MPPWPRSCNGSREKAQSPETRAPCRQPSVARNPRTAAAWAPLPRGRTLFWPESGWTRTDLYRTWRYRASLPMRARPVLGPTQPINGTGQTKDRMLLTRHHLGRGPAPPYRPAQHVQTQIPTRSAADSRRSDWMTTVDSDNRPGLATGPTSHRREDRPHSEPPEESVRSTGTTFRRANHGPTR
jgi:hypothetical protein